MATIEFVRVPVLIQCSWEKVVRIIIFFYRWNPWTLFSTLVALFVVKHIRWQCTTATREKNSGMSLIRVQSLKMLCSITVSWFLKFLLLITKTFLQALDLNLLSIFFKTWPILPHRHLDWQSQWTELQVRTIKDRSHHTQPSSTYVLRPHDRTQPAFLCDSFIRYQTVD